MTHSTLTTIACLTGAFLAAGCAPRGKVTVAVRDAVTSQPISGARVSSHYMLPMFSMVYAPQRERVTDTNGIARLQSNLSGGSQRTLFGMEYFIGPQFIAQAPGYQSATGRLSSEQFTELRKWSHKADAQHPDLILQLRRE